MTFGRWLLVHSLSIGILVMLGVGFFFKNELKLNEAYNQLLQIDAEVISLPTASLASKENTIPKKSNDQHDDQVKIEQADVLIDKNTILVTNVPSEEVIKDVIVVKKVPIQPKVDSQNTEAITTLSPRVEKKKAKEDYLLLARQAYWNKDYQTAIDNYSKEMEKSPNSSDLYGELGNLYYSINEYELASTNYLKAGKIMIDLNDQSRAKQIYDILLSIAPKKAEILLSMKNDKYQ